MRNNTPDLCGFVSILVLAAAHVQAQEAKPPAAASKTFTTPMGMDVLEGSGSGFELPDGSPKNVFALDSRQAVISRNYPWRSIGRVRIGTGGHGSGVLIGPNLVLTAAHCVIDPNTRRPVRGGITFEANVVNNVSQAQSRANYMWWGTSDPDTYRHLDWAIVRLNDRLGDRFGWFGVRTVGSGDNAASYPIPLILAGYSGNFQNGQTAGADLKVSIRKFENGFLLHDGNSSRGSSGCPIFKLERNSRNQLVGMVYGINVAERRNGGETSLYVDGYHERNANVGVITNSFLPTLQRVLNPKGDLPAGIKQPLKTAEAAAADEAQAGEHALTE